jgi:hypothetical protein
MVRPSVLVSLSVGRGCFIYNLELVAGRTPPLNEFSVIWCFIPNGINLLPTIASDAAIAAAPETTQPPLGGIRQDDD